MIKKQVLLLLKRLKGTYTEYSETQRYYNQLVACIHSERKLSNFQSVHLQKLLLHACQNVPFYARRLKNIFEDGDLDVDEFHKIPLLTKEDIRKYGTELTSKDTNTRKWYYNSSGGSTGEPVRFIQDELLDKWSEASRRIYYENIIGIDELAVKKIILWGSERDIFEGTIGLKAKVVNWFKNTKLLNSFRMSEKDMERYVKTINSYKPDLIRAYAGSLYAICKFIEKKEMAIHRPKAIVTSAEKLRNEMREKIESVFGTKVYDFYGSREVDGIAGECDAGLLHIFMFDNHVEILDERNQSVREGEMGKVIVTTLHNYSMPLIRFAIGDTATLGPKKCRCGNLLPTLKDVSGRITDHFIREDKTIIHGEYFTHLFYLKHWLKVFQVVQEDYKKIRIFIVLLDNINDAEKREIESKIRLVMGKDCIIIWEFVEEIPRTPSGKHLYTKSLLYHT
jgi:phenylacetate-CoA ligase